MMNGSEVVHRHEYFVKKGDVDLYVHRKYKGEAKGKPVLFLVHGSSLSSGPGFDLEVPGKGKAYSMMEQCAAQGFDVWTMDHEGYGRSSKTDNSSNISEGAEDLSAVFPLLREETGVEKAHLYGQSSGALRAALFAQLHPEYVEKLVLDAFVWTGEGSETLAKRREGLDQWKSSNIRKISRDSIRSIFTRDKAGTSEAVVAEAVADAQIALGDTVPTGTYYDMCANLPVVDPKKINVPTLILRGEHDGLATMEDLAAFLISLPNSDKQLTVLPGTAHVSPFGVNAPMFYHAMFSFLTAPRRLV